MRIATWNVNSIRTRVERVVDYLVREDVDVLGMQEIKCKPEQFPYAQFAAAGYEVVAHGLNQWNGVAFASRLPMEDPARSFDGMPGFAKGHNGPDAPLEARALGITVEGVRMWSLYVPNGRSLEDEHYQYKLHWLEALKEATKAKLAANPGAPLALMGDWNVAPYDTDIADPDFVPGHSTHISEPERQAFLSFEEVGMHDVVRPLVPEGYTFWDYQRLKFPRNEGMRIDFILGSGPLAELVEEAEIHRDERKGEKPSDHVPVSVKLAIEPDEYDLPVLFT